MPKIVPTERLMPNTATTTSDIALNVNRYAFATSFVKDKLVLDVACGSGYGSNYLTRKGARIVIAGDVDEKATRCAKAYYKNDFVIRLDAQEMPFRDACFDVVVSFETIEHLNRQKQFVSECRRVLKNGGLILCSTPNKEVVSPNSGGPTNPYHTREFRVEEFTDFMKKYFKEVATYGIEPTTLLNRQEPPQTVRNIAKSLVNLALSMKIVNRLGARLSKIMFMLGLEQVQVRRLEEVKDLDQLICRRYTPFPLQGNLLSKPVHVIAVGLKSTAHTTSLACPQSSTQAR